MTAHGVVFWDVDTQRDFMLPGGALYVPGAEKLLPRLARLVDAARQGRALLISSTDAHTPQDPELTQWPPHCLKGTPGQQKVPETLTDDFVVIPNQPIALSPDLLRHRQVIVEKQALDVFTNPNTEPLVELLGRQRDYVVFGVVTEYCVRHTVLGLRQRGCPVAVVTDAIETLDPEAGRKALEEFAAHGAQLITTEQALAMLAAPAAGQASA